MKEYNKKHILGILCIIFIIVFYLNYPEIKSIVSITTAPPEQKMINGRLVDIYHDRNGFEVYSSGRVFTTDWEYVHWDSASSYYQNEAQGTTYYWAGSFMALMEEGAIDAPYMIKDNWKKLEEGMSQENIEAIFRFKGDEYLRNECYTWLYPEYGYIIFADDELVKWEYIDLNNTRGLSIGYIID